MNHTPMTTREAVEQAIAALSNYAEYAESSVQLNCRQAAKLLCEQYGFKFSEFFIEQ